MTKSTFTINTYEDDWGNSHDDPNGLIELTCCYGDYAGVFVTLNGSKIASFGDYYHDKGEVKAASFIDGYVKSKDFDESDYVFEHKYFVSLNSEASDSLDLADMVDTPTTLLPKIRYWLESPSLYKHLLAFIERQMVIRDLMSNPEVVSKWDIVNDQYVNATETVSEDWNYVVLDLWQSIIDA